jgi:ABC-type dipeptide/oligopeptide/nickel transport system permease subunit
MKSRTRFVLVVCSIVFTLLGVAAFILLTQSSLSFLSTGATQIDPETGAFIESGVRPSAILTTMLPTLGIVFIAVGILCAAGAIASYVATEAVDRAAAHRVPSVPAYSGPEDLSTSETLHHG